MAIQLIDAFISFRTPYLVDDVLELWRMSVLERKAKGKYVLNRR